MRYEIRRGASSALLPFASKFPARCSTFRDSASARRAVFTSRAIAEARPERFLALVLARSSASRAERARRPPRAAPRISMKGNSSRI